MSGQALASAAVQLVGAPFRLHGRDPASGLDCVGVLAASLALCGRAAHLPSGYALRNRALPEMGPFAAGCGLAPAAETTLPGDVLLVRAGPGQVHLLIAAERMGFVHADAGLRRVVFCRGPLEWPVIQHWRLAPELEE